MTTLARLFDWKNALIVVKPETLVRWHRKGFRLFWRWKSRPKGSSPNFPVKSPYGSPGSVKLLVVSRRAFDEELVLEATSREQIEERASILTLRTGYSLFPTGLRTRVLSRPAR